MRALPGETVVYDTDSHAAHCLDSIASVVFQLADGRRSVAELAQALANTTPGTDERAVAAALAALSRAGLLEDGRHDVAPESESRRQLMRAAGVGAAALVTSILVPTPVEAANTCIPVEACPGNTQQPCYNVNPQAECPSNKCIAFQRCG